VFNSFIAESDEILTDISFYTALDNVDYTIKIFDSFENNELNDELSIKTGSIDYTGFHTIELDQPVNLKKDDYFYIYLQLSDGGHPFDRTSEIPVLLGSTDEGAIVKSEANPGESYYLNDGIWYDLYNYKFQDTTWINTANFCIKGLVLKTSDLKTEGDINLKNVKPGSTKNFEITVQNIGESFSKLNWEISEYPDWGVWSFSQDQGFLYPETGIFTIEVSIITPDEQEMEFNGELKIINKNDLNDFEIIQISLVTQKNRIFKNNLFFDFLENHSNIFPLIRLIIGLNNYKI
jgi:hypothetical protein